MLTSCLSFLSITPAFYQILLGSFFISFYSHSSVISRSVSKSMLLLQLFLWGSFISLILNYFILFYSFQIFEGFSFVCWLNICDSLYWYALTFLKGATLFWLRLNFTPNFSFPSFVSLSPRGLPGLLLPTSRCYFKTRYHLKSQSYSSQPSLTVALWYAFTLPIVGWLNFWSWCGCASFFVCFFLHPMNPFCSESQTFISTSSQSEMCYSGLSSEALSLALIWPHVSHFIPHCVLGASTLPHDCFCIRSPVGPRVWLWVYLFAFLFWSSLWKWLLCLSIRQSLFKFLSTSYLTAMMCSVQVECGKHKICIYDLFLIEYLSVLWIY